MLSIPTKLRVILLQYISYLNGKEDCIREGEGQDYNYFKRTGIAQSKARGLIGVTFGDIGGKLFLVVGMRRECAVKANFGKVDFRWERAYVFYERDLPPDLQSKGQTRRNLLELMAEL